MSRLPAVLWDMDGTLVDSEPMHTRTLTEVLASVGAHCDATVEAATLGKTERQVHAICAAMFGFTMSFDDWALARAHSYFRHAERALEARPGALPIYHALRHQGRAQAIVSNASRMILEANLRVAGLQHPSLVSVSFNDVRNGKPDAEPYLRAAWLLGVLPAEAVVVEDSPVGAAAGIAAGMRVLAWPQGPFEAEAFPAGVQIVQTADELSAALGLPLPLPLPVTPL